MPCSGRWSPSGVTATFTPRGYAPRVPSVRLPEADPVVGLVDRALHVVVPDHRDRPVDLEHREAHVLEALDRVLPERLHQLLVVDPLELQVVQLQDPAIDEDA